MTPLTPEQEAALAQLRDIRLPDPVGWWPPAPGWWIFGGLIVAAVVAACAWSAPPCGGRAGVLARRGARAARNAPFRCVVPPGPVPRSAWIAPFRGFGAAAT